MPKQPKDILPAFTPDDVRRLLAACSSERERALVLTLLDTGCRAAELCALTLADVDLKGSEVMIRQGKGKKDRLTFLGGKSKKAVWKYLQTRPAAPNEPLFPSLHTGDALTTSGLVQLLRRLGKRAGVDNCHPHTFRRTFALWSLRAGMDIFSLQKLMGHSDLTVLRQYLDQVREDLQEAHRKHGAVDTML